MNFHRLTSPPALRLTLLQALAASAFLAWPAPPAQAAANPLPTPLPNAHAHNDYLHERPLLDALDQGFCSVEADIHLVDGQLLVAHDRSQARPGRELEQLYLAPLHERVLQRGGRLFPAQPTFTLLIDIKADAAGTYAALKPLLARHESILTRFTPTSTHTNAVTIILSGDRPLTQMRSETNRLAAIDGRMTDLDRDNPPSLIPLVSESWGSLFTWRGSAPLPEGEAARLGALVAKAHAQGRRIRFWAVPDNPAGWTVMRQAGVDLINTDRLAALREFLTPR